MRIYLFIFLSLAIISCTKVDKNPELRDPVYSDIQSEIGALTAALQAKKKEIDGFHKEMKDVIPQTGQIKYVQKRIYEAEAVLLRLEQELLYFELKKETQLADARKSYQKSLKDGSSWPNPSNYDSYMIEKKFRRASRTWKAQDRIDELTITPKVTAEPAGH